MNAWCSSRIAGVVGFVTALVASGMWAAAESPPKLRYGFQAGRQCAYEVKIVAELEDSVETREGVLTYTVVSATQQQVVLKQSGGLAVRSKPRPGRGFFPGPPRFPMGPRFMGGPLRFGVGGPQGITIDRQGQMIVSKEPTPLPYLLGDMETLVIEELPAEPRRAWDKQREIVVRERKSAGPFPHIMFGPLGGTSASDRAAKERSDYTVARVAGDSARINKRYQLRTGVEAEGVTRFDMSGNGELDFDLKEGLIKSLSMKYEIRVNRKNATVRIPVSLTYRLLTAAELAEYKKRQEEAQAKAAAARAKAKELTPLERGESTRLLRELRSRDPWKIRAAADRLAKAPADENAANFARALAPLLRHSDDWVKGAAASALINWATPEAEEELIQATNSENIWVRGRSIQALGRVKTEKAAEAVAAQMYRNRGEASKALKAMGPVAEAAAVGCLEDRDGWVRKETCLVLAEIGGHEALEALREYTGRVKGFDLRDAENAIEAIQARLETEGSSLSAADSPATLSAQPELRTWHDLTGTYQVEAALVSYQDRQLTLKKKDGSTVLVPIEKLSKEDQAYVEERLRASAAKPANPFE